MRHKHYGGPSILALPFVLLPLLPVFCFLWLVVMLGEELFKLIGELFADK